VWGVRGGGGGYKANTWDQMPTGADTVAADALLQEVGGHRLGEPDDSRLGGAVDAAVHHAFRGTPATTTTTTTTTT